MASNYFDSRDGKTHCGRCDSASWNVLGNCRECEQTACDCCATVEGKSDLLCSQCALQIALEIESEPWELEAPAEMPELQPIRVQVARVSIPEFTQKEVA